MSAASIIAQTSTRPPDGHDRCRLMMVSTTGQDVFLVQDGDRWFLPEVEIPRFSRVMEEIDCCVRRNWNIPTTLLFSRYAPAEAAQTFLAVLEVPTGCDQLAGLSWCRIEDAWSRLEDSEDLEPFRQGWSRILAEQGRSSAPFVSLGWIQELKNWVEAVPGAGTVTSFRQLSGSEDTCLMQFNTSLQPLWYKAVGQSDPKEFAITAALSKWLPDFLPQMLAFDSERNAWLMARGGECSLRQQADFDTWAGVVRRLAAMQIASLSHVRALLQVGCIDARLGALQELVRPFVEAMISLMQRQVKNPPAPVTPTQLNEVGDALSSALAELAAIDLPNVIGHSDFNPGNILLGMDRTVFTDWSAAHVGGPWLTLEYLIAHFKKTGAALPGQDTQLRHIFREQWLSIIPYEVLRQAQELAPLVAVFASAVADGGWRDPARLSLPGVPGYLRSLSRIMRREAQSLNARRAYA
jgi:hypothetical protein